MNLSNIKELIGKCNAHSFYFLQEEVKSDETEIKEMEALTRVKIPSELEEFYINIGGLKPDYGKEHLYETWTLDLYSPRELISKLKEENKWNKLYSLGLIDMILFSWQHDRLEFKEYMKSEDIAFLNENYKSFASYTTDSTGTYTYLYFDKEGKFGTITYDIFTKRVHASFQGYIHCNCQPGSERRYGKWLFEEVRRWESNEV